MRGIVDLERHSVGESLSPILFLIAIKSTPYTKSNVFVSRKQFVLSRHKIVEIKYSSSFKKCNSYIDKAIIAATICFSGWLRGSDL